ncbi:XRE family transcriptional regulator [Microbacterium oleivorans]|uniref:XRE family transcriptional regulator n=1 Tax=Microbacterium oleivorans TaxID=273677 RepID=A0A4R5YFU6_9MICO|nr:XRE family transcriptional regulator [Microbacterium oleivorans]
MRFEAGSRGGAEASDPHLKHDSGKMSGVTSDRSSADKSALASFLRARRAGLTPDAVGIPPEPRRRVRGLRREEVARLAGISAEYYRRLEQGSGHQMSLQVCNSLARALRLDRAGTAYLQRLALPDSEAPFEVHRGEDPPVDLVQLITHWDHTAAYIIDRNQDIVVVNDLIRAVAPGYMEVGNNLVLMQFEAPPELRELASWQEGALLGVAGALLRQSVRSALAGDHRTPARRRRLPRPVGAARGAAADLRRRAELLSRARLGRHEVADPRGASGPLHRHLLRRSGQRRRARTARSADRAARRDDDAPGCRVIDADVREQAGAVPRHGSRRRRA